MVKRIVSPTLLVCCCLAVAGFVFEASALAVVPIANTGTLNPYNIAIDQLTGDIYVVTGTGLPGAHVGISKVAGGGITPVYDDIGQQYTNGLAAGGGYLFWGNANSGPYTDSQIFRAPESGSGPITAIYTGSSVGQPIVDIPDLAYQNNYLYSADEYGGRVIRLNSDGSNIQVLTGYRFSAGFPNERYVSISLSGNKVFNGDNAGIYSVPIGGGSFTTLAAGNFGDIAFLNDTIYAIGSDGVSIRQIPASGGSASLFLGGSPFGSLNSIAAYNGMLYVTDTGLHTVWGVPGPGAISEPNDYLIPGKSYMCEGSLSGLRQAYQIFDAGLNDASCTECAASRELKFLHAVTRTAMLFIDNNDSNNLPIDSFLEVAEKFGVNVLGDFFEEIDVNVPLTNDHYKIPGSAPDPNEISNFFSNKVADWITEVNDIIADLNSISDSPSRFRFFFEPGDTGLETPLEVDYGDLLILKGLLLAFKGTLESKLAYDVFLNVDESLLDNLLYVDGIGPDDVNSPEILHLINIDVTDPNQLSINDHFLTPYPNLLKVLPTSGHNEDGAAILAQAKQDLINGINYYFDALDYIQSEDNPPGTDPQEDELLYIDPNNQFFLNVVEDRLAALRDSLVNNTNMLCPVETTKTYNVYNSTHTLIGQLTLKYDFTGIAGPNGVLTFTAGGIPSPWEINETRTGYGPEINVELECHAGGHYDGYLDATLSQDGTSFGNGALEYWGDSTNVISGLSGQLTSIKVVNGKINLNPIFGSSPPVNPRDLLPLFNNENIPIAGTFGHGLGNDATLGGIFPGMKQQDWTTLFDLASAPLDPLPDLVGESVSSTLPVPSGPGDKGKISIVIGNWSSHAASGKINIDIYASLHSIDQPLDSNDIKLVTLANQSVNIARYSAKTYTASVQIPSDIEPGDYYILANIDSTNAIAESDEENNLAVSDNTYEIVWKFGSFDGRKNVKLVVNDSNGTPVTFALTGGGYGEIIGGPDFNQVVLNNTTGKSSLLITTKGKGVETSVGDIIANGPLKNITAKTTDLRGDISVDGSLSSLTLDDVAGTHTITIGPALDPKVKVTMKFDSVRDLAIDSDTPIKTITATEWLDTDDTPDEINVPSLDTLNIKGDKKRAIGGDFAGTLTVTNNASSLKIAGTLSNPLTIGGNVNSVTLNQLQGNLTIAGNAKTIKVNQTLYTSPPPSGTYYTLHIGGAASVQYVQAGKRKTIKITAGGNLYAY